MRRIFHPRHDPSAVRGTEEQVAVTGPDLEQLIATARTAVALDQVEIKAGCLLFELINTTLLCFVMAA